MIEDGKNGVLVNTGNGISREEGLAKVIKMLIEDEGLRSRLGQNGPKTIKSFSPQRVVDDWEQLAKAVNSD